MPDASDQALRNLESFAAAYPWPERLRTQGKPLEWLWEFPLTVAPAELWPHLIDTSRLNRALGLGEMEFEERDGMRFGSSVNGGVKHEWVEEPWTWISERELIAIRSYSRGFAKVARVIYRFTEDRLLVYFGWIPRGFIGRTALKVGVPPLKKAYERVIHSLQKEATKPRPAIYRPPPTPMEPSGNSRLIELEAELVKQGCNKEALAKIAQLIREGDDLDLYRIQPRRLAHEWGVTESDLVSACLRATRIGLLELSWDVICPHCRGVRDESERLAELTSGGSCDVCQIDFKTDLENAVEVTFHIHRSIRDVPKVYYCSAEPATKQHIKLQQELAPGEERTVSLTLEPGRYRMRGLGPEVCGYLVTAKPDQAAPADADDAEHVAWRAGATLSEVTARPKTTLTLSNDTDSSTSFIVEAVRWSDEALRPSMLFAHREFRDLFSEEYLAADVQLSVAEQTLLFTDMVGSTAFYREFGDPAAFVRVKDHFTDAFALIEENNGAVVKTIGDAVMAVFNDPLDAVRASEAMCLAFAEAATDSGYAVRLRVSLNSGPCIAVNLNTGIDYFGSTVNIAAKLQACAEAGEVALSKVVFDAPRVAAYIESKTHPFEQRLFEHPSLDPLDYFHWSITPDQS